MASSYSECSFYIIDLVKKKETFLCKGFSPYALGLHKFPYFNYQDFPYVLAKEDDYMSIVNVRCGFVLRLCKIPTHNQNYLNQRVVFLNDRTFITDEGSYYLSKYKMSDTLL